MEKISRANLSSQKDQSIIVKRSRKNTLTLAPAFILVVNMLGLLLLSHLNGGLFFHELLWSTVIICIVVLCHVMSNKKSNQLFN